MNKKHIFIALIFLVCLIIAGVVGVALEGDTGQAQKPTKTPEVVATDLVITEICAKNESIICDGDGRYGDYIEIHNTGADANLKGLTITNGRGQSILGDIYIPQNGYHVLFLGDATGFSLGSSGGDCVQIVSSNGKVLAQANTVSMTEDQVMLYKNNGYVVSQEATPGFANTEAGREAFLVGRVQENPKLIITEILVENDSVLTDEMGRLYDVVELFNASSSPIRLQDYFLSDSLSTRFRDQLPNVTLEPGSYATVFCGGGSYATEDGLIHVGFGLSLGDTLCLTERDGSYITMELSFPGENTSTCRMDDGTYGPGIPSPGYPNNEAGVVAFSQSRMDDQAALVINEVLLSSWDVPYNGEFRDVVEICNRTAEPVSTAGWYLSDGGDPYRYALPEGTLNPGEILVIQCSRNETGFGLSQEDTVSLMTPAYLWASRVPCAGGVVGKSLIRTDAQAYTHGEVSLGYENSQSGIIAYEEARLPQGLRITEMMSANLSYLKGPYGDTCDWIELYNASEGPIHLRDYALSDDSGRPGKYPLPDKTLDSGDYITILLSEETETLRNGYASLGFTLSASQGETVFLSKNGTVEDYCILPALYTDTSYGRPAGSARFSALYDVTPSKANGEGALLSAKPQAMTQQGVYEDVQYVTVELSGTGNIYYTTDCTEPTTASSRYTGPIRLSKTTVIRAMACETGKMPSDVIDLTYVINEDDSLPVVSVVTEPDNLWDYHTGIYVEGPNGAAAFPHVGANYWQPWEKEASISLYEKDGTGFSHPCGLAIFGAYSRALDMKSFSIFFRDAYGMASLNYPLFGEEGLDRYEAFILRCSGQDSYKSRMRDVLMTSLVAEKTNVAVQKYRPVVVYLNGEYWGVYHIREKINENYVAGNCNVPKEDVVLCRANGTSQPLYKDFITYVKKSDLSNQDVYDYVASQMDIVGYMDYIIAEIYVANTDNGNIKFYKVPEGKWTWVFFDTDYGFSDASFNALYDHLWPGGTGSGNNFSTALINGLLENEEFKEQFIERIAWQLNNIWTTENVYARIDELEALLEHDMKKDCARWDRSYEKWQGHVQTLRDFVRYRNPRMLECVQEYFDLTTAQMREYGFNV